jgi:hypothetical protein
MTITVLSAEISSHTLSVASTGALAAGPAIAVITGMRKKTGVPGYL